LFESTAKHLTLRRTKCAGEDNFNLDLQEIELWSCGLNLLGSAWLSLT